jgi:quinol monooxygenase YgiN
MAVGMYFTPSSLTSEAYDEVISRLEKAGAATPSGRLCHVALESGGRIQLFEVWESAEAFQAFGTTLVPILAELGIDPGQPVASPVHNVITS